MATKKNKKVNHELARIPEAGLAKGVSHEFF
jgi:hypothetical protein